MLIYGEELSLSLLPEVLAKPWVKVSKTLGRPPILSYASYCLDNWFKIDEDEEISLDNVALITNFLGGVDEDWFVTIHVCIEDAASDAIGAAQALAEMTDKNSEEEILDNLKTITKSLKRLTPSSQECLRSVIHIFIIIECVLLYLEQRITLISSRD